MTLRLHAALFTAGLMSFGWFVTPAAADDFNKLSIFHFNQPVEVPGHVLAPGTYAFRLAESSPAVYSMDVVQIFSEDQKGMDHLITTIVTLPVESFRIPTKPTLIFEERGANNPQAVQKWFYPGESDGWQFVYKNHITQLASNVVRLPAVGPTETAAVTAEATPAPEAAAPEASTPVAAAPEPSAPPAVQQEQTTIAQNEQPAPPAATAESSADRQLPQELPKTASNWPLLLVLGFLLTGSGAAVLGFGFVRNRA